MALDIDYEINATHILFLVKQESLKLTEISRIAVGLWPHEIPAPKVGARVPKPRVVAIYHHGPSVELASPKPEGLDSPCWSKMYQYINSMKSWISMERSNLSC